MNSAYYKVHDIVFTAYRNFTYVHVYEELHSGYPYYPNNGQDVNIRMRSGTRCSK